MIRERVTDPAEMQRYAQLAPRAREGRDIARLAFYGALEALEGEQPDGVVITRFPPCMRPGTGITALPTRKRSSIVTAARSTECLSWTEATMTQQEIEESS